MAFPWRALVGDFSGATRRLSRAKDRRALRHTYPDSSAITIEVIMISAAMLHGANNPTLARDMMFAVVMIALNGLVGLSLLLGDCATVSNITICREPALTSIPSWRWRVLGLVLPNFTTSMSGPRFSLVQEIFLIVTSLEPLRDLSPDSDEAAQ